MSPEAAPSNSGKEPEVPDPSSRIARYDQYFDLRTFSDTLRKTTKKPKTQNKKRPALVVRRIIDYKGQLEAIEIDVKSQALCDVLLDIHRGAEELGLHRMPPVADPELLFHSHAGLKSKLAEEEAKSSPNLDLVSDLQTAIAYILEDHKDNIASFERLTSHGKITYDLLWALFPGNTVTYHYHQHTDQEQLLLIRSVSYEIRPHDKTKYLEVACDVITNDGFSFGLAKSIIEIDKFLGERRIQDLKTYPLSFHPSKDSLRAKATARGRRFAKMGSHAYLETSGAGMREVLDKTDKYNPKRFKFNTYGRVMVDPVAFRIFQPDCKFNLPVHQRLSPEELSDDEYLICTPVVLGFCFGVKTWGGFAMDRVQDIEWTQESFNSLVLKPRQKTLVLSLVKQHAARAKSFDDVVAGKGKGLIGLLSGKPGCGKTLTAEAVAEVTRRPLYVVSAGELGTGPKEVDAALSQILQIAQTWNAVLLLDEAEVFLQARSGTDVTRNALVSIFLRQLEYYQGIMILTTNLIGNFDVAFESRIHFSIYYPDLDFDARRKIWQTFLRKTSKHSILSEELDKLAKHEMNGRQIKNAVACAQSISMELKEDLSIEHVETVLEVGNEWELARKAPTI